MKICLIPSEAGQFTDAHTTGSPGGVFRFERRPMDGSSFPCAKAGQETISTQIPFKLWAVVNSRGDQLIMALRETTVESCWSVSLKEGKLTETSWLPVPGTLHDNTGLE